MSSSNPSTPTPEGDKKEKNEEYSEDFEVEDKSEFLDSTNAFSVSEASDHQEEGQSFKEEEVDSDAVVLSLMSTIDEVPEHSKSSDKDGKSNSTSAEDSESRVPDELKGLQHYFERGFDDDDDDEEEHENSVEKGDEMSTSNRHQHDHSSTSIASNSQADDEQSGIEEILAKLERLTNAQKLLENVLDADSNMRQEDVEQALRDALAQLPSTSGANVNVQPATMNKAGGEDNNKSDPVASLSLTEEMAVLQKLIDSETISVNNDERANVAAIPSSKKERQFQDVFQELERTLSQGGGGESCEEQESIQNESFAAPENLVRQQFLWENPPLSAIATPLQFLSQPNSRQESNSNSLSEPLILQTGISTATTSKTYKKAKLDEPPQELDFSHTLIDPTQFEMEASNSSTLRSKTKTLKKQAPVPSAKSASAINLRPPTPPSAKFQRNNNNAVLIKESQSTHSIFQRQPTTPRSPAKRTPTTISSPTHKRRNQQEVFPSGSSYLGAGEARRLSTNTIIQKELDLEEKNARIAKLEAELKRQDSMLHAYQEDNQKLYEQLKVKETEFTRKEKEWEELVNSLKTEVATMKIQRLAPLANSPSRPGSATNAAHQKEEIERLKAESTQKSEQIVELRREIISLRNTVTEVQSTNNGSPTKKSLAFQEREKELQREIRGLNKQVRTLQRILYNKDPGSSALSKDEFHHSSQEFLSTPLQRLDIHKEPQVHILEARISELERNLSQADLDSKERLKDFQGRLTSLKAKYDEQIKEYELQLEDSFSKIQFLQNSAAQAAVSELQNRIDRGQNEIGFLKQEINRYKRELEIAQKSSMPNQNVAKQDAGTLSLAIKSFKSELAEKEKEIIKLKKEIADLNKTNVSLKREREKYLTLNNALSNHPQRVAASRVQAATPKTELGLGAGRGKSLKDANNTKLLMSPNKVPAPHATVDILQSTLEYEREEFEQMISNKKKEIEERDKIIQKLRRQLEELRSTDESGDMQESANKSHMLEELRSRVITQNELILKLKEHISQYRQIEESYHRLQQEHQEASTQVRELKQKLEMAKTMCRPENEILQLLGQKFDELNSRYLHREQQMETLLNRLSVRTGALGSSPGIGRQFVSSVSSSSSSDLDLRQLSPSLSAHLFKATDLHST